MRGMLMKVRKYQHIDEKEWIRCRVLSFLDTAYYDHILNKKETYENPSIELVAIIDDQVVGLIDIEYEMEEKTICTNGQGRGGMIWHMATHPDFQRRGIATRLLETAERIANEKGLHYLEAWTRDDAWVNKWYERNGFEKTYTYLHVFFESRNEVEKLAHVESSDVNVIQAFGHYTGDDQEYVKSTFNRVHECNCYVKGLRE